MDDTFELAVSYLLADETGQEARNDNSRSKVLIGLQRGEVEELLRTSLWIPVHADVLPVGLDYYMFDLGYRFGAGRAWTWLARVSGGDTYSSVADVRTAVGGAARGTIVALDHLSRRRMKSEPGWREHSTYWTNRANRARHRALSLVI